MAHVLVIDDDPFIADLLESVLIEGGHRATAAATPEEITGERFDLVITDLLSWEGFRPAVAAAWVGRLRELVPGVPVIVCTAHRDAAQYVDRLGADAVVTKPFEVDALLGLVAKLSGAPSS